MVFQIQLINLNREFIEIRKKKKKKKASWQIKE